MKYLLWVVVGGLAWWWWRRQRMNAASTSASPPASPAHPEPMVYCARCGVHLPLTDASQDTSGHYHCAEHRTPPP